MSESNQESVTPPPAKAAAPQAAPRQAQTPSPPPLQNVGRIGRFSFTAAQTPEPSNAPAKAANNK